MIVENFGARLAAATRERMGDAWGALGAQAKLEIQQTLADKAELVLRGVSGEDVSREMAHVDAQLANWEFVGSAAARVAALSALADAAKLAGEFLVSLLVAL